MATLQRSRVSFVDWKMWSTPVLCLLMLPSILAQYVVVTNGTSGEKCPVKKCLSGIADCIYENTCVCRPPKTLYAHNGHFACYRTNNVYGEVYNDPKVRNYNDEVADFPYFCRYLLTSVKTALKIGKKKVGYCECQLHAYNNKHRGKFFVRGVDFACQIKNTYQKQKLDFSTRVTGHAENGVYTYREEGAAAYLPDGPFDPTPADITGAGVHVKSYVDSVNNQFVFSIPECGWYVTFVGYDIEERLNQYQIPGVSFAVNCALDPYFYEHDRVIATAPVKFGGSLYKNLPGVPPLDITQALIIRAFTSYVPQTQPGAASECSSIGDYLKLCPKDKLKLVADRCFWITQAPKFVRCLDKGNNTQPVAKIYDLCVSHFCVKYPTCEEFVNIVKGTGCGSIEDYKPLADIVSGRICKPHVIYETSTVSEEYE